jgi:hypothetical protein
VAVLQSKGSTFSPSFHFLLHLPISTMTSGFARNALNVLKQEKPHVSTLRSFFTTTSTDFAVRVDYMSVGIDATFRSSLNLLGVRPGDSHPPLI